MRLLNTTTLKLHEFFGSDIPPYNILSHRWEGDEITYRDVRDGTNTEAYGWSKVRNACAFARDRELWLREVRGREVTYIWIDTCCIDKTSSAELTEAINSMFSWYQHADECYAYLKDVPSGLDPTAREEASLQSEWFKRGWTLQELLAPRKVVFISNDWKEALGSRSDYSSVILQVTGIRDDDFEALRRDRVSVARRMSWASQRFCTREEDEAYCLMGLFGVNMPLLYGEGRKAFQRLQTEILKDSDDESIFAWWSPRSALQNQSGAGLLARSPHDFKNSSEVHPWPFDRDARPYSMTNKGLQIEPKLMHLYLWAAVERYFVGLDGVIKPIRLTETQKRNLYAFTLNCHLKVPSPRSDVEVKSEPSPIIILLRRIAHSSNTYCRLFVSEIELRPSPLERSDRREVIFIRPPLANTPWPSIERSEISQRVPYKLQDAANELRKKHDEAHLAAA